MKQGGIRSKITDILKCEQQKRLIHFISKDIRKIKNILHIFSDLKQEDFVILVETKPNSN